jgi:hypothetical protein
MIDTVCAWCGHSQRALNTDGQCLECQLKARQDEEAVNKKPLVPDWLFIAGLILTAAVLTGAIIWLAIK